MVTFLQRTFTSLVHAHAGRTQFIQADAASRRGLIQALNYKIKGSGTYTGDGYRMGRIQQTLPAAHQQRGLLSGALHPPDRHQQRTPASGRRAGCDLQLQGLLNRTGFRGGLNS